MCLIENLAKNICNVRLQLDYGIKNTDSRKDAKHAKLFKSPSFPLCQRGMKGGFLDFLRSLRLGEKNFLAWFCNTFQKVES